MARGTTEGSIFIAVLYETLSLSLSQVSFCVQRRFDGKPTPPIIYTSLYSHLSWSHFDIWELHCLITREKRRGGKYLEGQWFFHSYYWNDLKGLFSFSWMIWKESFLILWKGYFREGRVLYCRGLDWNLGSEKCFEDLQIVEDNVN